MSQMQIRANVAARKLRAESANSVHLHEHDIPNASNLTYELILRSGSAESTAERRQRRSCDIDRSSGRIGRSHHGRSRPHQHHRRQARWEERARGRRRRVAVVKGPQGEAMSRSTTTMIALAGSALVQPRRAYVHAMRVARIRV